MRKEHLAEQEFYHIYNRGVDRRPIFLDAYDLARFEQSMREFNSVQPIGSIYENRSRKRGNSIRAVPIAPREPLVRFVAYGINPNHYHFLLEQVADRGIEKFMHRLGLGYSKYFNHKYKRSGILFQGPFKSIRVDSNEYLLHLSVYINRNAEAHRRGNPVSTNSTLTSSSWPEYMGRSSPEASLCEAGIVLGQFENRRAYEHFADEALQDIIDRKVLIASLEEETATCVETPFPQWQ